jgi:methyltransferase (TIGR00027 family)
MREPISMTGYDASRTALGTLYLRAVHQLFDAEPRILDDPVAARLLEPATRSRLGEPPSRDRTPEARALRAHVVLRSRFAEDRLAVAVQRGVTQYVILGAGFDTFAFRQPEWARALRIVEVDRSETQALKRSRLAVAEVATPANVSFASVDFERESLRDGLSRSGVSLAEPTFFSWLGVTMYLDEDAIDAVLRTVASFPEGSEIVLTFAERATAVDVTSDSPSPLARRVASVGEPFVSYFEPAALAAKLRGAGFADVGFLSPASAATRYFEGRSNLPVPRRTGIVWAVR